ncbi:MAG: gamma-glutamylcyclotransferase [Myxococcales bacterium]|nr:gamma-glutamylcyclotransferase [Myxococcales bacterium]
MFVSGLETVVFVYGTLRQGECNHGLLGQRVPLRVVRTLRAWELVDLGTYPALLPGGNTAVLGEVYAVDDETLGELDALEGHPDYYQREAIALDDGSVAQAYVMRRENVSDFRPIASGDWLTR